MLHVTRNRALCDMLRRIADSKLHFNTDGWDCTCGYAMKDPALIVLGVPSGRKLGLHLDFFQWENGMMREGYDLWRALCAPFSYIHDDPAAIAGLIEEVLLEEAFTEFLRMQSVPPKEDTEQEDFDPEEEEEEDDEYGGEDEEVDGSEAWQRMGRLHASSNTR